jgi:hypothetical protein
LYPPGTKQRHIMNAHMHADRHTQSGVHQQQAMRGTHVGIYVALRRDARKQTGSGNYEEGGGHGAVARRLLQPNISPGESPEATHSVYIIPRTGLAQTCKHSPLRYATHVTGLC